MSGERRQIVIIGGGITGLAAAFYLEKEIKRMISRPKSRLLKQARDWAERCRRYTKTAM